MLLEKIEQANDIKQIAESDYGVLAQEIREFLIRSISETGGHLGSNLGAVELTMALHLFLNLPEDKIIWDVGHQSYTHKILTGRRDGFVNLRKFGSARRASATALTRATARHPSLRGWGWSRPETSRAAGIPLYP